MSRDKFKYESYVNSRKADGKLNTETRRCCLLGERDYAYCEVNVGYFGILLNAFQGVYWKLQNLMGKLVCQSA